MEYSSGLDVCLSITLVLSIVWLEMPRRADTFS